MIDVLGPDAGKTNEELERDSDERRAQMTPEQLSKRRAQIARWDRETVARRADLEARIAIEEADTASVMAAGCWHGGDHDAMHSEAVRWVAAWAEHITSEAPPKGATKWGVREDFIVMTAAMRRGDIWASVPTHLRECLVATPYAVERCALARPA